MDNEIKVSVCCIAYNHEKYIRQALEGFIMQKTNFKFEVLMHDDASKDNTASIIKEYEEKYPDIIKPIYQTENQYSKDKGILKTFIFPKIQGKYVAFCDGDDYWTDPYKLQKQVDFLDANPDYSICFHPAKVIYEEFETCKKDEIFPKNYKKIRPSIEKLLNWNYIPTASVMYRWRFKSMEELLKFYNFKIYAGDLHLNLLHAKVGKIKMLNDVMCVYRKHPQGISSCFEGVWDKLYLKHGITMLGQYDFIYKNITDYSEGYKNQKLITETKNIIVAYLKNNKIAEVQEIISKYPEYVLDVLNEKYNEKTNFKKKYRKYKKYFNFILALFIISIIILFIFFAKLL